MAIGHCDLFVFVFTCLFTLLCFTVPGANGKMALHAGSTAPSTPHLSGSSSASRNRRHHYSKHKSAHHKPLTNEQKADQNLQFMLALYRNAADPDGRPKEHRKFGSNTIRLLRSTNTTVRSPLTSKGMQTRNIMILLGNG